MRLSLSELGLQLASERDALTDFRVQFGLELADQAVPRTHLALELPLQRAHDLVACGDQLIRFDLCALNSASITPNPSQARLSTARNASR